MIIRVKLNLDKLVSTTLTMSHAIGLGVTNKSNFATAYAEIETLLIASSLKSINTGINILTNDDMVNLSATGNYVIFDAEFNEVTRLNEFNFLFINGFIEILDTTNKLFCYRQNSENDELNKALNIIKIIDIQYKTTIALKSLTIDLQDYHFDFNYIYIPVLHRYYYVSSVEMMSRDICRLHLQEDVLMSWKALIKSQSAFVTRYQNSPYKADLIDERLPTEDINSYNKFTPINVTNGDVNVTLNYDLFDLTLSEQQRIDKFNILINTYTKNNYISDNITKYPIQPPTNANNLPVISSLHPKSGNISLVNMLTFSYMINACMSDSATATYVVSALWLPFDPINVFQHKTKSDLLNAGSKVLQSSSGGGEWVNYGSQVATNLPDVYTVHDAGIPYLVLADFYFNSSGGITDITNNSGIEIQKPYSSWEIYIPFIGWVEVDITKVLNDRIQIIYAIDCDSGLSTVYIYNVTDNVVVWSGSCQVGLRLNFATSNELENTRQKQANDLNMILGALSSTIAIGAGVAKMNPVAIAGGVISASKTIANAVNSNNHLFDRASMSAGTSNNMLYLNKEVSVRRTYHKLISIDNSVYEHLQGYPYNQYTDLDTLSGYVEIGDIHFDLMGYDIFQDEVTEIVALLKNGVIM